MWYGCDFAALLLRGNQGAKTSFKFVVIFLDVEFRGQAVHQLFGKFDFLRRKLDPGGVAVSGSFADFIREMHGMNCEAVIVGPQKNGVFTLMHGDLGDADLVRVLQRVQEKLIRLFPASSGTRKYDESKYSGSISDIFTNARISMARPESGVIFFISSLSMSTYLPFSVS